MTSSVTPEIGEPIFTLDTNKLYIGDGTTTADQLTELNPTFATTQLSDVSSAAPVNNTFLVYNSSSSEYQSLSWGLASLPEVYAAPGNPNEILAFDGNFGSPSYGLLAPTQIDINFLSDCSSLNPQDGDQLVYDSFSGQYINQPAPPLLREDQSNLPTSAPTTGIYNDSGSLAISTNSLQRLAIDASGNINIDSGGVYYDAVNNRLAVGTTTPQAPLSISNGGANGIEIYSDYAGTGQSGIVSYNRSASQRTDLYISTDETIFVTGGSERARIDSSGRLLVGTSSARTDLIAGTRGGQVQIEAASATTATAIDKSSLCLTAGHSASNAGSANIFFTRTKSDSLSGVALVANNNILGGLYFQGTDGTDAVPAALIKAEVDGTPGANDMPGRLVFSTTADGSSSPTERMRIDSSGNVIINTSGTPVDVTTGTIDGFTSAGALTQLSRNNNPPLRIRRRSSDGSVQEFFRDTSLVGSIAVTTTATAYNTSSDYRLKENVTLVTDGIARLQQLKPSRFNFIADPDTTVDGFIAHEVQTVVPEAITGEKDAVDDEGNPQYQGIDQSKIVPLVVAALQEAIGEIESLKARVAALEAN